MVTLGETLIDAEVSPVLHKNVPPAIDGSPVKVTKSPSQIVSELMAKVGIIASETTSTVSTIGSVHAPASSTETS